VERGITHLGRHRAVATRYDKLAVRHQAVLEVTAINEWLHQLRNTPWLRLAERPQGSRASRSADLAAGGGQSRQKFNHGTKDVESKPLGIGSLGW